MIQHRAVLLLTVMLCAYLIFRLRFHIALIIQEDLDAQMQNHQCISDHVY